MTRLGIVSNRMSDGNGGASAIAAFVSAQKDVAFAMPEKLADLPAAIRAFAAAGVDLLAIDGGDGTIRDVLSVLTDCYGDAWPDLAILPSGKTNLIARDVGSFGPPLAGVKRLVKMVRAGAPLTVAERPVLEALRSGLPPVRGLFFGAGVFTYATQMAGSWTFDRGIKQNAGVALTLARVLWRSLRGTADGSDMAVDGGAASPHFTVLATTLNRLMLGLWPFPNVGEGPLHWLAVQAPPRGLLGAVWASWRGALSIRPGYDGGNAHRLPIRLTSPFVVDGELYEPGADGVVLQPGRVVRFLSVNGAFKP